MPNEKRIRGTKDYPRGQELEDVLKLAEQFPANLKKEPIPLSLKRIMDTARTRPKPRDQNHDWF